MKALFVHDSFYSRGPGGEIYSFGAFPAALWQERFLSRFASLTVIGRQKPFSPEHAAQAIRSDGPGLRFVLLNDINTPIVRIFGSGPVRTKIREQVEEADALIIRGPSELGMIAARAAIKVNKPVAIEMTGCAFGNLWHHGHSLTPKSLTAKLYAPVKYLRVRQMVNNADHVTYVTKSFLQSRYPCNRTVANASNVDIETPSSLILQKRLTKIENQKKVVFGLIGNYDNSLKGLDIAITALSHLRDQLPPFELRVLGYGTPAPYQNSFTTFHSPLTDPAAVLNWLDEIDIYLQPSRQEGLPRGLIEAISRACPALASNVGGIPELLDASCLHKRGNIQQLSQQILKSLDPQWQKQQAIRNFNTAQNYTRETLEPIRKKFWDDFALHSFKNLKLSGDPEHKDVLAEI